MEAQQQQNGHVPKFGNWDNDGNVPYTLYFENARKGKGAGGGKMINPNDPAENPDAFSVSAPSPPRRAGQHERRANRDGGADAALSLSPNPYSGSPYHRYAAGGDPPRRGGGASGGEYSADQSSPLHLHSRARADSTDSGYGLVSNSVDRSRARKGPRGNETPTRGSAVPKFGDWDANPASADGYTHIFNKVREEKQSHSANLPAFGKGAAPGNASKQDDGYASSSCSCFGWCK